MRYFKSLFAPSSQLSERDTLAYPDYDAQAFPTSVRDHFQEKKTHFQRLPRTPQQLPVQAWSLDKDHHLRLLLDNPAKNRTLHRPYDWVSQLTEKDAIEAMNAIKSALLNLQSSRSFSRSFFSLARQRSLNADIEFTAYQKTQLKYALPGGHLSCIDTSIVLTFLASLKAEYLRYILKLLTERHLSKPDDFYDTRHHTNHLGKTYGKRAVPKLKSGTRCLYGLGIYSEVIIESSANPHRYGRDAACLRTNKDHVVPIDINALAMPHQYNQSATHAGLLSHQNIFDFTLVLTTLSGKKTIPLTVDHFLINPRIHRGEGRYLVSKKPVVDEIAIQLTAQEAQQCKTTLPEDKHLFGDSWVVLNEGYIKTHSDSEADQLLAAEQRWGCQPIFDDDTQQWHLSKIP